MKTWVTLLVVVGVIACIGAAAAAGLDATGIAMLAAIVAVGGAAIAGTRKMGRIQPAACDECGGLVSASAPYCKHCGARSARGPKVTRTGS